MTKRKKSKAIKCLASLAAACCAFSTVLMGSVSAETGSVKAEDLFVTTTTKSVEGKENSVTASEYGITFDMGTTVDKTGSSSVVSFGNQTENTINGVFKGDFGLKYQLTDYYDYASKEEVLTGEADTNIRTAQNKALTKIGGQVNSLLTFRIKPVTGEQYIDINLVTSYHSDNLYYVVGHLVVAYYDGSSTAYRTLPYFTNGTKDSKGGYESIAFSDGKVFSSRVMNCNPGDTAYYGKDWSPSSVVLSGNTFSLSTKETGFDLVWEDDVLKIVGVNYAGDVPAKTTYAAFDGADFGAVGETVTTDGTTFQSAVESIGAELGCIKHNLWSNKREFLINGCGLPKVNDVLGGGYTVSVINHGEKLDSVLPGSENCYNKDISTGYTIKNITGSATGENPATTYFNASTISKPDWLQEKKTASVTVDGVSETIDLPVSGSVSYTVPQSVAAAPEGKIFSYFEGSDGEKYVPGDRITLTENMAFTLTSVFADKINPKDVFSVEKDKIDISENGASFNLGNTITKSGSGTTDDPYTATTNTDGVRTENKLNGKFSGNLSIDFNISDAWGYENNQELRDYTQKNSSQTSQAFQKMLSDYGVYFQSILTFRITPASGNEYIDIHVVLVGDGSYSACGKLVVDYVDGTVGADGKLNHYIRTIDYYNAEGYSNNGEKVYLNGYSSLITSGNWRGAAAVCRSTTAPGRFSSSTLKLVWEKDVLKIVGQEAGGIEYTYAAFDGALYDTESGLMIIKGWGSISVADFQSYIDAEKAKGDGEAKKVLYEQYVGNYYVAGCGLPKVADKFKENYTVSVFNYGTVNLQNTPSADQPKSLKDAEGNNASTTQNGNATLYYNNPYSSTLASGYTIKSVNGSSFANAEMPMPYWYDNFAYILLGTQELKLDMAKAQQFVFPEYSGAVSEGKAFGGYSDENGVVYQPGDNLRVERDKTYRFTILEVDLGSVYVDGVKQSLTGNTYVLPAYASGSYGWVVNGGSYGGKVYKTGETLSVNVGDKIVVASLRLSEFALDTNVTARLKDTAEDSGLRFTLKFKAEGVESMPVGVSFTVTVTNDQYAGKPIEFKFVGNEYLIAETDEDGNLTYNFSFVSSIVNFTEEKQKTGSLNVSASVTVEFADGTSQTMDAANSLDGFTVSEVAARIKQSEEYAKLSEKQKAVVDGWIVA